MAACKPCRGTRYRVLVVDDHPLVRGMLARLIEDDARALDVQSPCEVGSGEEAVAQTRVYNPHVVLMDIMVPGMDGFEAARKIREDLPSVRVVMVTATGEPSQRQKAARLGAAGFLTKDRAGTDLAPLLLRVLGTEENTTNVPADSGSGR